MRNRRWTNSIPPRVDPTFWGATVSGLLIMAAALAIVVFLSASWPGG